MPDPKRIAVIAAQYHSGTALIPGTRPAEILDPGAGAGGVFTLAGADVPAGAMVLPLQPVTAVVSTAVPDTFAVENTGEEPVITITSGALTITIASGLYAGTYSTTFDGTPLTAALIEAAPVCLVLPAVSGTMSTGNTLSITPGLWLYDGPDPGDQSWQQKLDGADIPGGTGLSYVVQAADTGKDFTVTETFGGVSLDSDAQAAPAPQAAQTDIFVQYGRNTATGVNTPALSVQSSDDSAVAGTTGDGPFVLQNADGSASAVTLSLVFSAPAPGNNSGFGINEAGRTTGVSGFDSTLANDVFSTDSYFAGSTYAVDHVLSGLTPDTAYTVVLTASRAASGARETLYTFSGGQTASIQTTSDPVIAPVSVSTTSDSGGVITITQSAISGSWSYLGGLHIFNT